jgi:hypothetical protein
VRVVDARSPHRFSGLVGWCGSMRAFIDSIGNDVFTAAGAPVFGPAPHGLVPYETVVAGEHVVITRRLPPAPWTPDAPQAELDGPGCQIDQPTAQAANEAGFYLEDFRGDASWVQHDLADWPPLDGATADGWYRTDRLDEPGLPVLRGALLVQRVRGRIVDGAAPPGVARQYVAGVPDGTYRWLLAAAGGGTPVFQRAVWVTPASLHPADRPPARRDRHLVPIHTLTDIPVRPNTPIPAAGELVDVTIEDGIVVWVEAR